jgi:gluconolactonase
MVNITHVDVLALAASIPYANEFTALANASTDHVSFISYSDEFLTNVLGGNVTQQLVAETSWDAFHEAGVYNIETGLLYATSNFAGSLANPINVTAIDINRNNEITSIRYPNVSLANGGSAFYPVGSSPSSSEGQEIVFCDQGDPINPSRLTVVNPATNETRVLVNNFYGRNFTSLNDVEQHYHTGDLWFTDARYGYWQGFRPEPAIRPQVYRFEPKTGVVQAVADDFVAPNGLEFRYADPSSFPIK